MQDLKEAAVQFFLYELALQESEQDDDRELYFAVRDSSYKAVFVDGVGKLFVRKKSLRFIIFNAQTEEIVEWIR